MPFLKDFIINQNTKIKLWDIHLGELDYIGLDEYDSHLLKSKKNHLAKEQFLAVRKTLQLENPSYKIRYDKLGKPSINSDLNISISHSKQLAGIVFSDSVKIGIDIQATDNKILNIRNKFLNDLEKSNIEYDIDYLLNIWTAKESIYKAIGVKGASFSKNIIIDCVSGKEKEGKGYYINGNEKTKFNLKFFYLDNYTICYAYEY